MKKRKLLPPKFQEMARELGLNPKKFGKIDNHKQETWKDPLGVFIERLCQKSFGKNQPDEVKSVEELYKAKREKQSIKKSVNPNLESPDSNTDSDNLKINLTSDIL